MNSDESSSLAVEEKRLGIHIGAAPRLQWAGKEEHALYQMMLLDDKGMGEARD